MTAGQRNCYEALMREVEGYGLDDALFAVREAARDARDRADKKDDYEHVLHHIEHARQWLQKIALGQRHEAATDSSG